MKVQDIMTPDPATCTPDQTVREAARLMKERDCGSLPVIDSRTEAVTGVVTDRDIALHVVGTGKPADTKVADVMSRDPSCCTIEDTIDDVERIMRERQVRRVPVIDARGRCIGIVAQADLARERERIGDAEVAKVVEEVSEPIGEPRRESSVGQRPPSPDQELRR